MLRNVPRTGMRAGSAGSGIPVFPFPVHPVPHEEAAAVPVGTPRVPHRPPRAVCSGHAPRTAGQPPATPARFGYLRLAPQRGAALPVVDPFPRSLSPGSGALYGHRGDLATSEVVCSRTRDGPDRGAEAKGCPLQRMCLAPGLLSAMALIVVRTLYRCYYVNSICRGPSRCAAPRNAGRTGSRFV